MKENGISIYISNIFVLAYKRPKSEMVEAFVFGHQVHVMMVSGIKINSVELVVI